MMNIIKKVSLDNKCSQVYTGGIYTNSSYKLLDPINKEIDIYNNSLYLICKNEVCNSYISITSSSCHDKYYVLIEDDLDYIYLVDNKYKEIDKIKLNIDNRYKTKYYSISYNSYKKQISISTKTVVFTVTIDGYFVKEELSRDTINEIRSNSVVSYSRCNYNYSRVICINSIVYICGKLYISYTKNDSVYISEISPIGNIVYSTYIDDNIFINAMLLVNNKLELLITRDNKYNYIYKSDFNTKCNYCEIKCNNECRIDYECNIDKPCDLCGVISSIAEIESSLAAIIYAESEKIKKATSCSIDSKELICVNDSVTKMIMNITMLEQILTDKLSLAIKKLDCKK